mgnify:CR=1 FL=1
MQAPQPQYGQQPQQVLIGQPQAAQHVVGMGVPGIMGVPATSATAALILSIMSLVCGGICLAIPALIVANKALAITDQYPGHPDAGTAKAAQVISWVIIGLSLAVFLLYAVIGVGFLASENL